jgi:hypothetical protein
MKGRPVWFAIRVLSEGRKGVVVLLTNTTGVVTPVRIAPTALVEARRTAADLVRIDVEGLHDSNVPIVGLQKLGLLSRSNDHTWLETVTYFIPRQISEPWLGDIRETRSRMRRQGYSRRWIEAATASQMVALVVHWTWERVWDLITPFKNRSAARGD